MARKKRKKKTKMRKPQPYEQVKMKWFSMPDPFGDAPPEVRRQILREVGAKAKATFEQEFPHVAEWFKRYDPLYVLSFCVYYFLTSEPGVDKEVVEGKLDFGSHHLELLQAIALMGSRGGTPEPLKERAKELQESLRTLTDAIMMADLDFPEELPDAEIKKRFVLSQMRTQTLAIRNWAFPEQTIAHMKALYAEPLGRIIADRYAGVSSTQLIDAFVSMGKAVDERLNEHIQKLIPMMNAKRFEAVYAAYRQSFPDVIDGCVAKIAIRVLSLPHALSSDLIRSPNEATLLAFQMATLRAQCHPALRPLVLSLSTFLPRCRRDDARARTQRGSHDCFPLGAEICS